jgi:glycosyltransferase involved in cell wall biosynthesis
MLKALFVTSSLTYGGAENHTITLMNRLADRGHECHAAYIKGDHSLLNRVRLRSASAVRCLAAERFLDTTALAELAALVANVQPSVIVSANPYALLYAVLAKNLARARPRMVVTYHSTRLLGAKDHIQMLCYRPLFWTADCAIFVCERQRRHWLRRGVLAKRNVVIYNGVDIDQFTDETTSEQRAGARGSLGFADSDFVIGAVGGLREEKNQVQLIDAVHRLRSLGLPARALLIGDGPMRAQIEARAREIGVAQHVAITGFASDVRPWVTACDVVAVCSTTEAMSLAALEAMALCRPVLHSDVGSAAEIIEPVHDGFLFPVNDTAAIVACLTQLVDASVRRAVGARARAVVERRFSERTMIGRYENLLIDLTTSSDDRRRPSRRVMSPYPAERRGADTGGQQWQPLKRSRRTAS